MLSDARNRIARQFGLAFALDESLRPHYKTLGIDLAVLNGDDSFELPLPATYAIARDGTVLNAWVDADYRKRPEPETILRWLDPAARAA